MKLFLIERIELVNRFPKEGGIRKLMIFDDLLKKLRLSQVEMKDCGVQDIATPEGMTLTWNKKGTTYVKDFKLTTFEEEELKGLLAMLSRADKFPNNLLNVAKQLNLDEYLEKDEKKS